MKKTISTSIAKVLFYIEEDGYQKLEEYLSLLRLHFDSDLNKDEIISDIEGRIAEHFIECTGGVSNISDRIVTEQNVAGIIKSMGMPDDFEDEIEESADTVREKKYRKLYRDADMAALGGVAAGLAAFFGVDPVWVRLAFLASIFFGGAGVVVYLILWFVIPEATSATQKLEMRGDPINLKSVKGVVNEKFKEARARRGRLVEFLRLIVNIISEKIVPIIGKIIGVLINIFVVLGIIALVSGFIIGAIYPGAPFADFTLYDILPGYFYHTALLAAFIIFLIPLIFAAALGTLFMGHRPSITGRLGGALFGIWLVAIIIAVVTGFSVHNRYQRLILTHPQYQDKSEIVAVGDFKNIEAKNGQSVVFRSGPEYKIKIEGRAKDIDKILVENDGATLSVRRKESKGICFFCVTGPVTVEVMAPEIETIRALNAAQINGIDINDDDILMEAENGSRITVSGIFENIGAKAENSSKIKISGTSLILIAEALNGSRLQAEGLDTREADIKILNASVAEINARETLKMSVYNGSSVVQYGDAPLPQDSFDSSSSVSFD